MVCNKICTCYIYFNNISHVEQLENRNKGKITLLNFLINTIIVYKSTMHTPSSYNI